ncbi:MAG: YhfC family intramembrane metalloprotease [Ignavibacteria bacterium]|jgi:hypothetical protein|nr:YhfC family intramembrane metalloprotease [Ignavibacteria bacterium]MCU7499543.1 YhfC family intramembrane metalloprotease [Ignavibacteria bacterium]MCU7512331.1 YhfC family intramembrane metalloprotease [Ignavibacteria bacterium]MCU7519555.1 YhfC family intramembrane metalloprotease [Ignavibacteria bacterium]MCU7524519.1 YhfC family intramembrane metalloprotease [Ignavibacteria bacterium]
MKSKKVENYLQKIILIFIAIIPLLYFNQIENVPLKAFVLGAGSWGIGCIFKLLAYQIILSPLHKTNKSLLSISLLNGLLSGIVELLAAYVIILLMKDKFAFDFNAIISFGLAIGSFEIFIAVKANANKIMKGTALEAQFEKMIEFLDNTQGIRSYFYNVILPVVERIACTFIHISTRGLVFITVITGSNIPIFIALAVFVIADGCLGYYYHISGKLATSKGYIQVNLYLLILSVINTVTFFIMINPYRNFIL